MPDETSEFLNGHRVVGLVGRYFLKLRREADGKRGAW